MPCYLSRTCLGWYLMQHIVAEENLVIHHMQWTLTACCVNLIFTYLYMPHHAANTNAAQRWPWGRDRYFGGSCYCQFLRSVPVSMLWSSMEVFFASVICCSSWCVCSSPPSLGRWGLPPSLEHVGILIKLHWASWCQDPMVQESKALHPAVASPVVCSPLAQRPPAHCSRLHGIWLTWTNMTALDGILAGAGIANHLKLHYALHPSRLFHKQFCHVLPSRYRALLPTKTIYLMTKQHLSTTKKEVQIQQMLLDGLDFRSQQPFCWKTMDLMWWKKWIECKQIKKDEWWFKDLLGRRLWMRYCIKTR